MTQRHKWADVIIAWASGEECQYRMRLPKGWSEWATIASAKIAPYVAWQEVELYEYRVKPKDVVFERRVEASSVQAFHANDNIRVNVRYTFDSDTKELKSVELIK